MADSTCAVCGQLRSFHDNLSIHHQFSTDGQLIEKPIQRKSPANAREHIIAPSNEPVAVRLAAVLHTKGVFDDGDLVYVLTGGDRPGERGYSPGDSAKGDLRTRA